LHFIRKTKEGLRLSLNTSVGKRILAVTTSNAQLTNQADAKKFSKGTYAEGEGTALFDLTKQKGIASFAPDPHCQWGLLSDGAPAPARNSYFSFKEGGVAT
jgi:hypothetical protein